MEQNENTTEASYLKHLFNWKYIVSAIVISLIVGFFDYYAIGNTKSYSYLIVMLIILQIANFKTIFFRKLIMFFFSFVVLFSIYFIVTAGTIEYFLISNIHKYIEKTSYGLPKMLNDEIQIVKVVNPNYKSVVFYLKTINAAKDEILKEFDNSPYKFEKEMLEIEKKTLCNKKDMPMLFKKIDHAVKYLDNKDNLIGTIVLKHGSCN